MPPTALDLINTTKRHLYTGFNDELNTLNGAMTAGATTLNLGYDPVGIARGTTLAIDLEEMYVWGVVQRQVTVQRGMNGSTAAAHTDGSLVHVKPKFSSFRILQALNEELQDLSSPQNGLFRILTADLTYNPAYSGYDLPGSVISVQEVRFSTPGARDYPDIKSYEVVRDMPTTDFASGTALLLYEEGFPGRTIRVKYRAPFGTLTALTDDVVTGAGLPATATDIPPLGAALRLAAPREIKRNFTEGQGEPRRADEVPPGAAANSPRGLAALRAQRILAEATRLVAQYPYGQGH